MSTLPDKNGHHWMRGRLQAEDEQECSLCRCVSDERAADLPCPKGKRP